MSAGYTDVVVLGMGGSSLAPEVFRQSFGPQDGGLTLHVLDSTHPQEVKRYLDTLDLDKTLAVVSSKSGGTIEPNSMFKAFHAAAARRRALRRGHRSRVIARSRRQGERLPRRLLRRPGHRRPLQRADRVRPRPRDRRGLRRRRRAGLRDRRRRRVQEHQRQRRPVARLRARRARPQGRDKLTFVADAPLDSYGVWSEQLFAESTGKLGRGILPIADEPLLGPDDYGDDRVFLHVALGDADNKAKLASPQGRRPPGDHDQRARPVRPRPDLLPQRVRGRRRRLGPGDQSVRPAQRARGQGQHQPGAQARVRRTSRREA